MGFWTWAESVKEDDKPFVTWAIIILNVILVVIMAEAFIEKGVQWYKTRQEAKKKEDDEEGVEMKTYTGEVPAGGTAIANPLADSDDEILNNIKDTTKRTGKDDPDL